MFVQDVNGNWYEINEDQLKGKKIDNERVRETTAAIRAEKRKKVADLLTGLDSVDLNILADELAARSNLRSVGFGGRYFPGIFRADCPECQCPECQCPECQCPECSCPECSCPECSSMPWWSNSQYQYWGAMRARPAWRGMNRIFR